MKIRCEYKKLSTLQKLLDKSFSKLKELIGSRKIGAGKFSVKKHGGKVVNLGCILLPFKSAKNGMLSRKCNLRHPAVAALPFPGSLKSSRLGSSHISTVISVIAKPKVFSSIVERVAIDMVNHYSRLGIHDVTMQIKFPFRDYIFAHVKFITNPLSIPLKQSISF